MKKIIATLFCAIVLITSILGYGFAQLGSELKNEGGKKLIQEQLDLRTPMDQAIRKLPGSLFYRGTILKKVDAMQEALFAQDDVAAWLQQTAIDWMHCLANPSASLPANMKEDFYALLNKHQAVIVEELSLPISQADGEKLLSLLYSYLDVRAILTKQIAVTRRHMNSLQLLGIRLVDLCLYQDLRLLMLGVCVAAVLGLLILQRRKGLLITGGLFLVLGCSLFLGYLLVTHTDILFLQADAAASLLHGIPKMSLVLIGLGSCLFGYSCLWLLKQKTKARSSL